MSHLVYELPCLGRESYLAIYRAVGRNAFAKELLDSKLKRISFNCIANVLMKSAESLRSEFDTLFEHLLGQLSQNTRGETLISEDMTAQRTICAILRCINQILPEMKSVE